MHRELRGPRPCKLHHEPPPPNSYQQLLVYVVDTIIIIMLSVRDCQGTGMILLAKTKT